MPPLDPDPTALLAADRLSRTNIARHAQSVARRWSRSGWLAAQHVERVEAALARELDAASRAGAALGRRDGARRAEAKARRTGGEP